MRTAPALLRLTLVLCFALPAACASSRAGLAGEGQLEAQASTGALQHLESHGDEPQPAPRAEAAPVLLDRPSRGKLRLSFPVLAPLPELERLHVEEIRPVLAAFESFQPRARPRLRVMLEAPGGGGSAGRGSASAWEPRLREDFLSRFGPPLLPMPESLETSRLYLALKLSTRYMDDGIREAAQELFNSPAFLASLSLSVVVYFAAWLAPEPLFSKAFAAALTVRLSLLVGLVELGRLAMACLPTLTA